MDETAEDLVELQRLMDTSMDRAGRHLRSVIQPERRLSAAALVSRLYGMRLLTVATVTADNRPIAGPVDGIFFRGHFHFGSAPDAVRIRHLHQRPQISATHLQGEALGVTVHGRATLLNLHDPVHKGFRRTLLSIYQPRYGAGWEEFLDSETVYARIDARRLFTFTAPRDDAQ